MTFIMPAEWEKHKATWLAWPHYTVSFPNRVAKVEKIFAEIIWQLHTGERVELFVTDNEMRERVTALLKARRVALEQVNFHLMDYTDVWTRDCGPTFVIDKNTKQQILIKWRYNAYGRKYPDLLKDGNMPDEVGQCLNEAMIAANIICEGGALETNGQGLLLTTEQCLLNPNRNPKKTKNEIESELKKHLGVSTVIWLPQGLLNDDTDGHVDELARFVSPTKLVCAFTEDKSNPNYETLQTNYQILSSGAEVIKLPLPRFYCDEGELAGKLAPASYTNFYIANQVVLVPQFKDPHDAPALAIIQSLFPNRRAIGLDCTDLIFGGGALHCVTQQQPAL